MIKLLSLIIFLLLTISGCTCKPQHSVSIASSTPHLSPASPAPSTAVTRKGDELHLNFENGKAKILKDNASETAGDQYVKFSLEELNTDAHTALIRLSLYEGAVYQLYFLKNGNFYDLITPPVYSPDHQYIAEANADASGFTQDIFRLSKCTVDACKEIYKEEAPFSNPKWIKANLIRVDLLKMDERAEYKTVSTKTCTIVSETVTCQ